MTEQERRNKRGRMTEHERKIKLQIKGQNEKDRMTELETNLDKIEIRAYNTVMEIRM